MRQGELLGLRWQDVDFERGLIRLRRQLQRPGEGRPAALAPLKMDSQREVVLLPRQLAGLLREHRGQSRHADEEDFVFTRGDGEPLHYSQMNRLLHKIAKAAGVERVSAHVFGAPSPRT